jgi:cytochrome P450
MVNRNPPGPRDWTFGWSLARNIRHRVLETYAGLNRDYGDRVLTRIGPFRLYFFFHPDDVHDVLVTRAKSILRDPRPLKTFEQWNGRSLVIVEGEAWKRQRRMVQPAFQSRRFAGYAGKMSTVIDTLGDTLQSQAGAGHIDVDMDPSMTALTLNIICQTMFSTDIRSRFDEMRQAMLTLSEIAYHEMQDLFPRPAWLPTRWNRRKKEAIRVLDDVVWSFIRQRRQDPADRGDLLSMLLATVDEEGDGGKLSDEQVRNEAMTLMLAGHDTTAAALNWLWWILAAHPDIADRCRDELATVCSGRLATFIDLAQLPYLTAVVKETLRMYPPAFGVFLRKAIEDVQIGEYLVPKGSLISLSSQVTHHDERWYPDPERFDPERFLPPRVDNIPHGAWFPFGMGPRVCIGQSFAMTEMLLIAARLLPRFDVGLVPGEPEPVPHLTLALRPRDRLLLRFRAKS